MGRTCQKTIRRKVNKRTVNMDHMIKGKKPRRPWPADNVEMVESWLQEKQDGGRWKTLTEAYTLIQ